MPLQATSGAASYDAFGGGVAAVPQYIEDVFSTYLYTGNGSTQTITNGVDLAGKGGLVWFKNRGAVANHLLLDSARGSNALSSNTTGAEAAGYPLSMLSTGFTINDNDTTWNASSNTYASWTFRKQPKFFDVVTYTGNGTSQTINHNLGSTPGFIICKSTTSARNWLVYHRSIGATKFLQLDTTIAAITATTPWNDTAPTSTTFTVGSSLAGNESGQTFVAYIFAHNAGGFGLTGTDNVISCGSYTGNGNNTIELGYEPQWVLLKNSSAASDWVLLDTMRGMSVSGEGQVLYPNLSNAEIGGGTNHPTATGFKTTFFGSGTIIYIAIRKGPMKVPTSGTSVFNTQAYTGTGATQTLANTGFPVDLFLFMQRNSTRKNTIDRLRGLSATLVTTASDGESDRGSTDPYITSAGPILTVQGYAQTGASGNTYVAECFRRAPSFFDEVCYTGTGAGQVVSHNLGVVPQLMIFKCRSTAGTGWIVTNAFTGYMSLNLTTAQDSTTPWDFNGTAPTATQLTTRAASNGSVNASGSTYVAYLFATCAGVSKVGLYTGTGTTLQVDCGFTGGARFVLIKRTDSTGDWYVWDSARGIVAGNDPYLLLNSTASEVTNTDYVDTYSAGFEISSTAPAAINASGGTFIFLAIA